ncbi:MAG: hypothetical protein QOG01_1465 [Pseudonocardiales bacterium]|nr:hypothetical protein [Pseudonocardiales bacterium]
MIGGPTDPTGGAVVVDHAEGREAWRGVLARRAAFAGIAAAVLAGVVTASALARSSGAGGVVSAVEASTGHHLPANPMLQAGERVLVTVRGFAPAAPVTVGLVGVRLLGAVVAGSAGAVVYPYAVPRSIGPGQHALVFSGAAAPTAAAPPGNVEVTVPLTTQWPFRTSGRPTRRPSGASSSGGVAGVAHGRGHGPTAFTGVDVLGPVAAGVVALLGGLVLVRAGRRRRSPSANQRGPGIIEPPSSLR